MPDKKTTVLVIVDGLGITEKTNVDNPITSKNFPHYFGWLKKYPNTKLEASGEAVGLFKDQEGNSEAGHINLGAGRVVKQDAVYVSEAIADQTFFKNSAFLQALHHIKKYGTDAHVFGLLSNHNSAHSCPEHLYAVLELLHRHQIKNVFLHLFTDGRDSGQHDAPNHLKKLQENFFGNEKIASVMGRFYALDRNKDWKRTQKAYDAMVEGRSKYTASNMEEALTQAYNRGETDEFITPTVIVSGGKPLATIKENDALFFFNLRSDRARQLTKAFVQMNFEDENKNSFKREHVPQNVRFVAMTDFGPDLQGILTAFPSRDVKNSLVQVLCPRKQMYVAESEKFAHITYFFNGGYAQHFCDEEWVKIPSPIVSSYDKKPEMSASGVVDKVISAIESRKFDFIACNFANLDMVGHTGNFSAGVKAVEVVDGELNRIVEAVLKNDDQCIITADHGNIEEMKNESTGEIDTEHSTDLVPCFIISNDPPKSIKEKGGLCDVAPTVLKMMDIKPPKEMTGKSLY